MKITKTIDYTLSINEPNGHGIEHQGSLENDTAVLMMSLNILEDSLQGMKDAKKQKGANKKEIGKQINMLSKLISYQNNLVMQLCDNYEVLKASA